jgi:molybdopterin/thiamine biosynthesis adenylyltransferase
MKFFLNAFLTVVKNPAAYELFEKSIVTESFNEDQKKLFERMLDDEGYEEAELVDTFGEEIFLEWVKKDIFVTKQIDRNKISSRSDSYYWHKHLEGIAEILRKKKVLILGCGGLGSHIAWNMAALGVGTVYLLDYDIVEESNLNRQMMFDIADLGKYKVEVLKEKLSRVNPSVEIVAMNRRIDSQTSFMEVMTECNPDCAVKALDLPVYISKWMDEVCSQMKIKYVTAILFDTAQMIGPTYIPEDSLKYGDFFEPDESRDRVSGIAPSLGFVMYQMAGELSEEIFKILTQKGKLKYKNKIMLHENITDERMLYKSKKALSKTNREDHLGWNLINLSAILFIYFLGNCFMLNQFVILGIALTYATIVPIIISHTEKEAFKFSYVAICGMLINNIVMVVSNNSFAMVTLDMIPLIISIVLVSMSILVLAVYLLELLLFLLKRYLIHWRAVR